MLFDGREWLYILLLKQVIFGMLKDSWCFHKKLLTDTPVEWGHLF
jgi:hypothetical protein